MQKISATAMGFIGSMVVLAQNIDISLNILRFHNKIQKQA